MKAARWDEVRTWIAIVISFAWAAISCFGGDWTGAIWALAVGAWALNYLLAIMGKLPWLT